MYNASAQLRIDNQPPSLNFFMWGRWIFKVNKELFILFTQDYVPHSLRNIPSGPYGDRELKIEKETIESMVTELINRNITDDEMEKSNQVELGDKDKISSAINTLLSLSSDGLKQLSRKNILIIYKQKINYSC